MLVRKTREQLYLGKHLKLVKSINGESRLVHEMHVAPVYGTLYIVTVCSSLYIYVAPV